jgi:ribosomal protein S18 acetylase RimI-like enzyme
LNCSVRKLHPDDFEKVMDLHDRWVFQDLEKAPRHGFLLARAERKALSSRLASGEWSGLIAEVDGSLAGYLISSPDIPEIASLDWMIDHSPLMGDPMHRHVREIAVSPAYLQRGVGRLLYKELSAACGRSTISAFVAMNPVGNSASEGFHRRLGFKEVATFRSSCFLGIPNYSSTLFALM